MKKYVKELSWCHRPEWWLIFSGVGLVATVTCTVTFSLATRGLTDTTLRTMAERPFTSRPWTAAVLGLLIGLVFVALCVIILRKTRSHQVDSLISAGPAKFRWHALSRRLLFAVPLITGPLAAVIVAYLLKVSVICAGWAAYMPIGLLYREQKRIYEEAKTKLVADTETKRITRYVEKVPWLARPESCLLNSALGLLLILLLPILLSMASPTRVALAGGVPSDAADPGLRHVYREIADTVLPFNRLVPRPWTAIPVGLLIGLLFTGVQRNVLRKARLFYADFIILQPRERLTWRSFKHSLLHGVLPIYGLIGTGIAVSWLLQLPVIYVFGASYIPSALLYWEQKKIYEAAKAKLAALKEGTT